MTASLGAPIYYDGERRAPYLRLIPPLGSAATLFVARIRYPDIGTYGVLQEGIKATWWDIEYCMYHDICGSRFRLKSLG